MRHITTWELHYGMSHLTVQIKNFKKPLHPFLTQIDMLDHMFEGCSNFNQDLSYLNLENVNFLNKKNMIHRCVQLKREYHPQHLI